MHTIYKTFTLTKSHALNPQNVWMSIIKAYIAIRPNTIDTSPMTEMRCLFARISYLYLFISFFHLHITTFRNLYANITNNIFCSIVDEYTDTTWNVRGWLIFALVILDQIKSSFHNML